MDGDERSGVAIIGATNPSVDVQLGSFFNVYTFLVKPTNTKTVQSGTATATVQCLCANRF